MSKKKKVENLSPLLDEKGNKYISKGRVSFVDSKERNITPSYRIVTDILEKLIYAKDDFEAMDVITDLTPDGKIALNTYITFTNRGGEFIFRNPTTGRRTKRPEMPFKKFSERIGFNNGSGLDGLGDQFARSAYTHGGIAFEIIVSEDLKDIVDIVPVDPSTFQEFKYIDDEFRYAIYQKRTDNQKVDLYEGNFLYFPYQPKVGSPVGTIAFLPAIQALTAYYQFLIDVMMIINRVGFPRYKMMIDDEAILERAMPNEKDTPEKRDELFQAEFDNAVARFMSIAKDSDLICFKSNEIDTLGGGVNGSGIDARAWVEVLEPLICNAFRLPPVMMGRQKSGSYALGTAEYEAFVSGIEPTAKDIKRAYEAIGNMFCRIYGYNAICEFIPTPLDWEDNKKLWEANLLKQEFYRKSQEYEWIDANRATQEVHGDEKAYGEATTEVYQYIVKFLQEQFKSTEQNTNVNVDENEDGKGENEDE